MMTTADEQKLIDIKFKLDMYYSMADTAESTLEKIQDDLNPTVKLNENQQIVLEWLKKSCTSYYYTSPMLAISKLYSSQQMAPPTVRLSKEEQYQVLAAFAECGMEQEEE